MTTEIPGDVWQAAIEGENWPRVLDCGCVVNHVKETHFTVRPCDEHREGSEYMQGFSISYKRADDD